MGAWGTDTFDNDTACDWSYGLKGVDDLAFVRETLWRILEIGDDYLDSDDACQGLAACEVVARLKGNWGVRNPYTETADKWVDAHKITPPDDVVQSAEAVINRVLTSPSELLDLWEEGDATEWRSAVENLRSRVI